MRVIVCGSRETVDGVGVFKRLDHVNACAPITLVIEGGQRKHGPDGQGYVGGVDFFAKRWAITRGVAWHTEKAQWKALGRAAGPVRNIAMADLKPDGVIALPGGDGTADMKRTAAARMIPVLDLAKTDFAMLEILADEMKSAGEVFSGFPELVMRLRDSGCLND